MAWIYLLFLLSFVTNTLCDNIPHAQVETEDINNYRLDEFIIPSHYDVEIKTYMLESHGAEKLLSFDGSSEITISTNKEDVDRIVLHMNNLRISKTELLDQVSGENLTVHLSEVNNITEKLTIQLDRPLRINRQYILSFVYSGIVNNGTRAGIYRQSYKTISGDNFWYIATYFQPGYARTAFPCFDEPSFKTTFALRINHENEYTTASNTIIDFKVPLDKEGRTIDVYKKTPKMSTYLFSFVISTFARLEAEHKNFSIFVRPDLLEKMRVSLSFGMEVLQELDNYTGFPYMTIDGLGKLDFVALPASSGGMEHWGLINFGEMFLQTHDGFNDGGLSQYCYELIAHEVAHQWFGNLVTCSWWTHTWLNEGFANYFSYIIGKKLHTKFDWDYYFAEHNVRPILETDGLATAFEISGKKVETVAEIKEMFGKQSYRKGSSIIRMIHHMLGEEAFKRSIQTYLRNNAYQAVTPQQLGDALNEHWNNDLIDIHEFLSDWSTQSGSPTVIVHLSEDGRSIKLTQKQFVKRGPNANSTKQWLIPFTFTTNVEMNFQNLTPRIYIRKNTEQVIQLDHKADWVIGNIQQVGLYRVHYDDENWEKLAIAMRALNRSGIHKTNFEQLKDDGLALFNLDLVQFSTIAKISNLKLNETYGVPDTMHDQEPSIGNDKPDKDIPSVSKVNKELNKLDRDDVDELLKELRKKFIVE